MPGYLEHVVGIAHQRVQEPACLQQACRHTRCETADPAVVSTGSPAVSAWAAVECVCNVVSLLGMLIFFSLFEIHIVIVFRNTIAMTNNT